MEMAGAVMVLVPRLTVYGALTLLTVCAGAFVAQVTRLHGDVVHVFVLAALAGGLAWANRPASALAPAVSTR